MSVSGRHYQQRMRMSVVFAYAAGCMARCLCREWHVARYNGRAYSGDGFASKPPGVETQDAAAASSFKTTKAGRI